MGVWGVVEEEVDVSREVDDDNGDYYENCFGEDKRVFFVVFVCVVVVVVVDDGLYYYVGDWFVELD